MPLHTPTPCPERRADLLEAVEYWQAQAAAAANNKRLAFCQRKLRAAEERYHDEE